MTARWTGIWRPRWGGPVKLDNDANCFVLSEAIDGAAARPADADPQRVDVVFGATLGTGVGGGFVVDGRVVSGANGAAAEWSHTTLPFLREGEKSPYQCFCGHPSCIESFTSGRGLAGAYRRGDRRKLDAPEVGRRAGSGDAGARRAFEIYEDRLASRAGGRRQPHRPARHRPGRWRLEQHPHLRERPQAVGALHGRQGPTHEAGARGAWRRQRRAGRRVFVAGVGSTGRPNS